MSDDPLIGRQLANFKIERVIGRGGMAIVYYGQDVKLERPVAIKVIDTQHRDTPAYAERFIREAKTVAAWRHEHIIQIHYADDEDGLYYFAMEYIDGTDLGQMMMQRTEKGRLLSHDEVVRIGRAVAEALDFAHKKNVIHRDVKPSNVMVDNEGRVVLTDFGLALDVEQGSLGEVFGSSRYIAPEQARKSADAVPASDLYSLGVILYEMLVGKVPFDDPSPTAVALQHLTSMPPTPRQINPNLNTQVEAVLLKALSKAPEDRYATGQELLDALEQALSPQEAADINEAVDSIDAVEALFESNAEGTPGGVVSQIKISKDIPADASPTLAPPSPGDEADDLIGQQFDEYRLEALLGQGGMARVYRALDVGLNRYVAIKVIDAPFRSDSDAAARFEREAQAIAQLEHPHIVRLYRYGEANNMLYMAMQYIEGADLETVLDTYHDDEQLMPPEEIVRVTREICEALDHAHSKDVIHRDIKPSNVMLTPEGSAILTDFGLALLTEYGTKGEIFGSPYYIAPEQAISSAKVVPQSDFYAVGCMLYEMVTGQVPFDADTAVDVAMLHMSEPPKSPRDLRADLGEEMEAIILKLLAKDPAERYPDGASIADAVEEAMQTETPAEKSKKISHDSIPVRVAAELAENPLPPIPSPSPQPADAPPPEAPAKKAGDKKQSLPPIPAAVAMRASLPTRRMEEPEPEREPESPHPIEAQKPKPTAAEAAKSSKKKNDKWPLILFTVIVVGIMLGVLIVAGIMVAIYFANAGSVF